MNLIHFGMSRLMIPEIYLPESVQFRFGAGAKADMN